VRILVVEDDRKVARFVRQGLCEEGHTVEIAPDGAEALKLALGERGYDLIILDVMLPGRDGFGVLKALRARKLPVPVLMLTARDSITDRVAGLDLGADDYLTKPFAFEEFLARVRALLRRRDVLSRQMIGQHVWGLAFDAESNVIDVYVGHLRRKIDRNRERRLLHTVRGAGYVLQVEE